MSQIRVEKMRSATGVVRDIPMDVYSAQELGWCGAAAEGSVALLRVPDIPDTRDPTPGHFRIAYFHPDHTVAWYTNSVDAQATVKFTSPKLLA